MIKKSNRWKIISLAENVSFYAVFALVHCKERPVYQDFARAMKAVKKSRVCGGGHFLGGMLLKVHRLSNAHRCSLSNTEL